METVHEILKPAHLRHENGFCYTSPLTLGRAGDKNSRSICVLMENGRPLAMPRAVHADIRKLGMGRYSHWTAEGIYFSASDNTDPRTNGREYALVSQQSVKRHTLALVAREPVMDYHAEAVAGHLIQNQRVTLRHLDERTIIVPKLAVRGSPDLTSVTGMLQSILRPGMTDEQKCTAIWKLLVDWRYHYYPAEGGDEVHDPVKFLNVYGYGFCDDSASNFAVLSRAAGLRARIYGLNGHVVGEAYYGERWHMFDPDHEVIYRMPAGHVASVEELAAHPEIITATPRDPIGSDSASIAKLYTTTNDNQSSERNFKTGLRLEPKLLPRDELVFELNGQGRSHRVAFRNEPLPPVTSLGRLIRQVDLGNPSNETVVRIEWPYVILGGQLELELTQPGAIFEVAILKDKESWTPLPVQTDGAILRVNLDAWFEAQQRAHYSYALRLTHQGTKPIGQVARAARLTTHFQCAPRPLPHLESGGTTFEFHATSGTGAALPKDWRGVEIIHEWDEVIGDVPVRLH
jgi:hypothetical protein